MDLNVPTCLSERPSQPLEEAKVVVVAIWQDYQEAPCRQLAAEVLPLLPSCQQGSSGQFNVVLGWVSELVLFGPVGMLHDGVL